MQIGTPEPPKELPFDSCSWLGKFQSAVAETIAPTLVEEETLLDNYNQDGQFYPDVGRGATQANPMKERINICVQPPRGFGG